MAGNCWYHKTVTAVEMCTNCGKFICAECTSKLKGQTYCKSCVEKLFVVDSSQSVSVVDATIEQQPVTVSAAAPLSVPQQPSTEPGIDTSSPSATSSPISDKGNVVPVEIRGWNWGAFLANWIWGIGNKVWIGLLALIPLPPIGLVMSIILGIKGNEWAWKSKRWNSIDSFKNTQRTWTWVGAGLVATSIVITIPLFALGLLFEPATREWNFQQTIKTPITVTTSNKDVAIGNLDTNKVEVKIPGTALGKTAQISLKNPDQKPVYQTSRFTPLGSPIDISANGVPTRLQETVTITFKIDKSAIEHNPDPEAYRIAYFTDKAWVYYKPTEVNLEKGIISFQTDHFSIFGYGEISLEEKIAEYSKNKVLAEWAQGTIDDAANEAIGNSLSVLFDKMGIKSDLKKDILSGIIQDGEYGELIKSYKNGDTNTCVENMEKLLGSNLKKILDANNLEKYGNILDSDKIDLVIATAKSLGSVKEQDYKEAATVLTDYLLDKSPYWTAFKALKETGETLAKDLNNQFIENAYQVYAWGKSDKLLGFIPDFSYSGVQSGNFDDVWNQSYKVQQILKERFKSANNPEKAAHDYLLNMFEKRKKLESETATQEKEIKDLTNIFLKEAKNDTYDCKDSINDFLFPKYKNILGSSERPESPSEKNLDLLFQIIDKIKTDTGTTKICTTGCKEGILREQDMIKAASALIKSLNMNDNPDKYRKEYLDLIKAYSLQIVAPDISLANKGIASIPYTFKAKSNSVPFETKMEWSYIYKGITNKIDEDQREISLTFNPTDKDVRYTVICKAPHPIAWDPAGNITKWKTDSAQIAFDIIPIQLALTHDSSNGEIGKNYKFTAIAPNTPPGVSYRWYRDNTAIGGTINENSIKFDSGGNHTVKVELVYQNKAIATTTVTITLKTTANPEPKRCSLSIEPLTLKGEPGKSYPFTAKVVNPPAEAAYDWFIDDNIKGKDISNIANITFSGEGSYHVTVKLRDKTTDKYVCEAIAVAGITVPVPTPTPVPTPIPTPTPNPIPGIGSTRQNVVYCSGSSSIIQSTYTEIKLADGTWEKHGLYTVYYCPPNAHNISHTGTYVHGVETGTRSSYYPDGKRQFVTEYVNNRVMKMTEYYNDKPFQTCYYTYPPNQANSTVKCDPPVQ